jgi:hypothetical protein
MTKGPRILGIHQPFHSNVDTFNVIITLKQLRKVPEWVLINTFWEYSVGNDNHCEVIIQAKDELEAAMRFKKLWAALTKLGE